MNTKTLITSILSLFFISITYASFSDIQNHKYKDSIEYLQSHNIVKGYDDGTFGPDREINRAEILKIILKSSLSGDIKEKENCFPDVQNQRYAKYVCYAKNNKIIKGYPDGEFKPSKSVTNAEGLKMALESFGHHQDPNNNQRWYQGYIDFVHNNNIFSKYTLRAEKNMTRGEMAYLTHQLMLEKEGKIQFDGIRKVQSQGCGTTQPQTPPTSLWINGQERHFITAIGKNYNSNTPTKLIIAFHGRTNSNDRVRSYYHVEEQSKGNAIFVYPSGLPENSSPRSWSNPGDPSDQLRDFALFDAIVEEFSNKYCINKDQIFVIGHSLGAWFTNSLACARGDVIRAIGTVGGSTTINNCAGPTAAIIMHNPKDNLASFAGGITARNQLLSQNACSDKTVPVGPSEGHCVKYVDCQDGADVIRCPETENYTRGYYYPHSRPSFAASEIWNFFEEQK